VHSFYVVRENDQIAINGVVENTAEAQRRMPALKFPSFFKAGDEPEVIVMPSNGEWWLLVRSISFTRNCATEPGR